MAVRVNCTGDAGAVCSGTVKIVRGKSSYGSKTFTVQAGKTATVKVSLRKSAKSALRKAGNKAVKSMVVITGADSAGARSPPARPSGSSGCASGPVAIRGGAWRDLQRTSSRFVSGGL